MGIFCPDAVLQPTDASAKEVKARWRAKTAAPILSADGQSAEGSEPPYAAMPELIEDATNELTGSFRLLIQRLLDHLKDLERQVRELEQQIQAWHRSDAASCKLASVPGIGPLTASALVASIGDAKSFKNGRQLAAWLGLVPKQNSSGGKNVLLGISKRGDTYLRTLLIHGARSIMQVAERKQQKDGWLHGLLQRRNSNVAVVALANKNARIIWALLAHDREFRLDYTSGAAAA
ncbi:IS110 family transposase [Trinickia soli]|uniref:IS110 family transposase n=1 Tax=Trinickia soli TaxID=380675 RepID=UPI0014664B12|nr:IS110 family transposase [Trinickia soli]CAB3680705.1 hypothetical protein LMG24076_02415 [Trinickia soli]